MKTSEVLDYYHTQQEVADKLGVSQPSVSQWGEYPPPHRQIQIQKLTRGKLKAEPNCWELILVARTGRPPKGRKQSAAA